jgi:hypothetical protein
MSGEFSNTTTSYSGKCRASNGRIAPMRSGSSSSNAIRGFSTFACSIACDFDLYWILSPANNSVDVAEAGSGLTALPHCSWIARLPTWTQSPNAGGEPMSEEQEPHEAPAPEPMQRPKRSWYQFSLRTMFVVVTLVCVGLGGFSWWAQQSREWIRQRRDFLYRQYVKTPEPTLAPSGLWLFGEKGVGVIWCYPEIADAARQLFPEATIKIIGQD